MKVTAIPTCSSCSLRLTAKLPGPGNVTPGPMGFIINENPTVSLNVRGQNHNLIECIFSIPGGHRLADRSKVCEGELFVFFQNDRDISKHVCISIPLDIGPGTTNKYFSTLDQGVQKNRPTLGDLVPANATFVNYMGADVRGRDNKNRYPGLLCSPVKRVIDYYVMNEPARISAQDYNRFVKKANASPLWRGGPPQPVTECVPSRILKLGSLIRGITVEAAPAPIKSSGDGYDTKALKCYRLDEKRDIVDGKVYIGGKPADRTLNQELERAAIEPKEEDLKQAIQPGDIQKVLGIVLGITIGIMVVSVIGYYVYKFTYKNYDADGTIAAGLPIVPKTPWIFKWLAKKSCEAGEVNGGVLKSF